MLSARDAKREVLAWHALAALAELGFARVNLREIAQRSELSLGRIHYYFADKVELLILAVDLYKDQFVRRIEKEIDRASTPAEVVSNFANGLALSVAEDAAVHRLWYDVRAQALFDAAFVPVVERMETRLTGILEKLLNRIATLAGTAVMGDPTRAYFLVDARFQRLIAAQIAGAPLAQPDMARIITAELEYVIAATTLPLYANGSSAIASDQLSNSSDIVGG